MNFEHVEMLEAAPTKGLATVGKGLLRLLTQS
ncbi:hypothetical protein FHU41_002141 [Psychromicrobium silvestre]|uniref:Uncharacterized protein n=1 Tax=Psychromicrobium silvestre TaxID=1645614 RepID=A0A7Y9LUL6_9MICC|nr:hypothetical protein [Psychromicrobium silvestre]